MSLLHTKAVNCQWIALAILFSFSTSFANPPAKPSSIIPRATVTTLTHRPMVIPAKRVTSKPVVAKSKTKTATFISRCMQLLTGAGLPTKAPVTDSAAAEKTPSTTAVAVASATVPAAVVPTTEITPATPVETVTPISAGPTLQTLNSLLQGADYLRDAFENSVEKKPEDLQKFEAKAREYVEALKLYLDAKSIQYSEFKSEIILSPTIKMTYPLLVLSAEGNHRLNRFAAGMKRRYDSKLVLDFIFNRRSGDVASYNEKSKGLFLSEESLATERVTVDEIEEILHVRFAAERNERDKSVGHVPVQMFFVSATEMIGDSGIEHDYMTEMTFEDIWAQAVKLSIAANQLKDKASPEGLTQIKDMVEYLAGMTETAELAVDKAKLSALEGQPASLNKRKDESAYLIFGYEKMFNFGTFIPQQAISNSGDYAIREMNDAAKLMKFMREYFYEAEATTKPTPEELLAKAMNLRGALYDYVSSMGRSKPTAEATYDVVASLQLMFEDFDNQ